MLQGSSRQEDVALRRQLLRYDSNVRRSRRVASPFVTFVLSVSRISCVQSDARTGQTNPDGCPFYVLRKFGPAFNCYF